MLFLPYRKKYAQRARDILNSVETTRLTANRLERECLCKFEQTKPVTYADCEQLRVTKKQSQALTAAYEQLIFELANIKRRVAQRQQKRVSELLNQYRNQIKDRGWIVHAVLPPEIRSIYSDTRITFYGGEGSLRDARNIIAAIIGEEEELVKCKKQMISETRQQNL